MHTPTLYLSNLKPKEVQKPLILSSIVPQISIPCISYLMCVCVGGGGRIGGMLVRKAFALLLLQTNMKSVASYLHFSCIQKRKSEGGNQETSYMHSESNGLTCSSARKQSVLELSQRFFLWTLTFP